MIDYEKMITHIIKLPINTIVSDINNAPLNVKILVLSYILTLKQFKTFNLIVIIFNMVKYIIPKEIIFNLGLFFYTKNYSKAFKDYDILMDYLLTEKNNDEYYNIYNSIFTIMLISGWIPPGIVKTSD